MMCFFDLAKNGNNVIISLNSGDECMLNEEEVLILDKNQKDITSKVISESDSHLQVQFSENSIYTYNKNNLSILTNPVVLNCVIRTSSKTLSNINKALKFNVYIKVFFKNGTSKIYHESDITTEENLLKEEQFRKVFDYLKEMANYLTISDIVQTNECEKDKCFLKKVYEKVNFLSTNSVLKNYMNGKKSIDLHFIIQHPIYPFSFNLSQKKAIKNAFENNISVIEGPPGTGKTQTILNIISNAITNKKTVAVLSNNNSATDNIFEKLEKHNLSSLCAKLGKSDNIKKFLRNQKNLTYPESWAINESQEMKIRKKLFDANQDMEYYLNEKNEMAVLKQELEDLKLEQKHFQESNLYQKSKEINIPDFDSEKLHQFLLYLNSQENRKNYFSKKVQIISQIKYNFFNPKLYTYSIKDILDNIEKKYYKKRIEELENIIIEKEKKIESLNLEEMFTNYTELSMQILKNYVYRNYNKKNIYNKKTVKNTEDLIQDYPVILSTTYSLLNCVDANFMFDYIIIDESSQVDIVSSFPALSLAKNVVIVGDSKQLPNIINSSKKKEWNNIFARYNLDQKYNYTENSLLELTKKLYDNVPTVILKEHYRCHPKIINFCNKKFYDNQLIILSKNSNEEPIKQYKCVKGNHARKDNNSQYNDRQAQVIKEEVVPQQKIDIYHDSVGIITPYKAQKEYLKELFSCDNLSIDTVHGFQGREKETIIFSTVANEITKFLDNPNSINVAISRAINKLYLITPFEYKSDNNSNISNLISYINYNNFEVIESKINSVFDLLYKANEKERETFLLSHLPFSKYYSETLMYYKIKEILQIDRFKTYEVMDTVYPLRKVVKDDRLLTEEEKKFVRCNSHIDFLIYNKFDKMPILAIEVDGYRFHKRKEQRLRDEKKDSILTKCNIEFLRFMTNNCNEKEKIIKKLDEIIKRDSN